MRSILRSLLAVLLGAFAAGMVILVVELLGSRFFPLPAGVDRNDPEALKAAMANLPLGAFLSVLLSWFLGTAVGAWIAARMAGRSPMAHGLAVGVLLLAGGIANMLSLPHPVWFWIAGIALFLPAAYLGARLAAGGAGPRRSPMPA